MAERANLGSPSARKILEKNFLPRLFWVGLLETGVQECHRGWPEKLGEGWRERRHRRVKRKDRAAGVAVIGFTELRKGGQC